MEKKGYSRKGFFGETIHYDADGNKVGESRKNFSGGYDHFDSNGNKVGSSHENFWGGMNHYDAGGEKQGSSHPGFWGQTNHYNAQGNKTGESIRNFSGGQNHYGTDKQTPSSNPKNEQSTPQKPQRSTRLRWSGFDELLATVALAGFTLFILGLVLRWDDIPLYFVTFVVSFAWYLFRNK